MRREQECNTLIHNMSIIGVKLSRYNAQIQENMRTSSFFQSLHRSIPSSPPSSLFSLLSHPSFTLTLPAQTPLGTNTPPGSTFDPLIKLCTTTLLVISSAALSFSFPFSHPFPFLSAPGDCTSSLRPASRL